MGDTSCLRLVRDMRRTKGKGIGGICRDIKASVFPFTHIKRSKNNYLEDINVGEVFYSA